MKLEVYTNPVAEKVDDKSAELIAEFDEHYAKLTKAYPQHQGQRALAFQSWIIQKVAGLQLCVAELEKQLSEKK